MTESQNQPKWDLEERTAKFGEDVINFCKSLRETTVIRPIISQLIRSASSIGANYCEADDSESKKDFRHKIGICKKEARETKHWLRMLAIALSEKKDIIKKLWAEAKELHLIFNSIYRKVK
ncbi:MAG: four helix bundle protein [Patescibacteria group bacterium]